MSDEDIIRRRLLTQTAVGHKGVPPLTKLTKRYLQFCEKAATGGEASSAELQEIYGQLMRDVANIEFLAQKQEAICAAHRAEQASFVQKKVALQEEVEAARRDIESRKVELVEARELRQHKEEYEQLRAAAVQFPRCADMEAEIAAEEAALAATEAAAAKASQTVELRKKQFALLLHTISSLSDEIDGPLDSAVTAASEPAPMETDA